MINNFFFRKIVTSSAIISHSSSCLPSATKHRNVNVEIPASRLHANSSVSSLATSSSSSVSRYNLFFDETELTLFVFSPPRIYPCTRTCCFNVYTTSIMVGQRCTNVKKTLCPTGYPEQKKVHKLNRFIKHGSFIRSFWKCFLKTLKKMFCDK